MMVSVVVESVSVVVESVFVVVEYGTVTFG